jgi:MFS family permease
MVETATEPAPRNQPPASGMARLWDRQLSSYPDTRMRFAYLGITVLATVILYYELYIQGAVATKIITYFGMTFTQFVFISVVGNLVGAFASLAAGLADRWGRANITVIGLFITGILTLFGLPNAPNTGTYLVLFAVLSIVEGMILVATPALVRDFSPQLGRASAMGFWTFGPVLGSLVVTVVSSNTLDAHPDWQFQFRVCGIAGIIVAVIALIGLRELSPRLRDQLMVSLRDRTLIEARAKGLDLAQAMRGHWRQMLRFDVVGSAFAISIFLLFYYIAVGFFVVYFATVFGYSEARANGLANWYWVTNAIALVASGFLSDKLGVRKPFMILGAVISLVGTAIFAILATQPDTSYYTFAVVLMISAAGGGLAYCAWMANFTETVERHNPAATATGLAVWGWTIRIVITVALAVLTLVVPATSALVDQGPRVSEIAAKYPEQIKTATAIAPATLAALKKNPADPAAGAAAVGDLVKSGVAANPAAAVARLTRLGTQPIPAADAEYLTEHGATVAQAKEDNPHQWQTWWWVCFLGQLIFIPFIFITAGRWSPRKAREDAEQHEAMIQEEMAQLERVG